MTLPNKILRKPAVVEISGFRRATLATRIKEGTFPPPIPLGARAVGWVSTEVNSTLSAMIAGYSQDELKALVARLIAKRKELEVCA